MNSPIHRAALRAALRPVVEDLELRTLLSASFDYGYWAINEGDGDDTIVIRASKKDATRWQAVINGKVASEVAVDDLYSVSIHAGAGDDTVRFEGIGDGRVRVNVNGAGGNDSLAGSSGRDSLNGGDGDDVLYGRRGDDRLIGAAGDDEFVGGSGDDLLRGEDGDDSLVGGVGNDLIAGAEGDDSLGGSRGDDTLAGGTGGDEVLGGADDDQVHGGYDEDTVGGEAGDDTLWGGLGDDALAGGGGADTVHHEPDREKPQWDRWDTRKNEKLVNPMKRLDDGAAVKKMLIDEAVRRWGHAFGRAMTPWQQWRDYRRGEDGRLVLEDPGAEEDGGASLLGVCGGPVGAEEEPPDHSDTNTQEQDVDEADLIKTNGEHLFLLQQGELVVLDAWPADETRIVSRTAMDGELLGLYLLGERVVVLARHAVTDGSACQNDGDIEAGTRCEEGGRETATVTTVTTYDVSDPAAPKRVEETSVDGTLGTSRVVDGRLYMVMNNGVDLPSPQRVWHEQPVLPDDWDGTLGEPLAHDALGRAVRGSGPVEQWDGTVRQIKGYYLTETEAEYRKRLEAMPLEKLAPRYTTRTYDAAGAAGAASDGGLVRAGTLYVGEDGRDSSGWWNMTSVVLMDLKDDEAGVVSATSILGKEGTVYASRDSLYIALYSLASDTLKVVELENPENVVADVALPYVPPPPPPPRMWD